VPRLMAELGVAGVLFTADALHCQREGFAQAAAATTRARSATAPRSWAAPSARTGASRTAPVTFGMSPWARMPTASAPGPA
jgi:hypothetical protein